jgi:putative hydrolase of the HAD superfamily
MNRVPVSTLLIDADDTLWENNVYFEQVREKFLCWMADRGFSVIEVQENFVRIEHENIRKNCYAKTSLRR